MQNQSVSPRWVEALFSRLSVRYADAWLRKWDGLPMEDVKADWQRALQTTFERHPEAIAYALENLPEWPPTCDAFARICVNAPSKRRALEAPAGRRDPERMRALMAKAMAAMTGGNHRADLLAMLEARERDGRLTPAHSHQLECLRRSGLGEASSQQVGEFVPIPQSEWPWVKRGEQPYSQSGAA